MGASEHICAGETPLLGTQVNIAQKTWDWLIKKTGMVNNTAYNRRHWKKFLRDEKKRQPGMIGYEWGDPENAEDRYGNYRKVLEWLRESIGPETHVVEIGSLGGKWTQYMGGAKRVTCVDLFEETFLFLKERLGGKVNISFYRTRGDELKGIPDRSADLAFSMDAFPRIPKRSIRSYFREMFRVLRTGGRLLIHLPCSDIPFCRRKAFSPISGEWIRKTCEGAGFRNAEYHYNVIRHGVILKAEK